MDRRHYLANLTALAGVGIAGCTEDSGPSNDPATSPPTTQPTDTPTPTQTTTQPQTQTERETETETETAAPAEFRVTSIDAPSEVQIGTRITYSITVENVGGTTGSVQFDVQNRTSDSGWSEPATWTIQDVPPGETRTRETQEWTLNRMDTVTIRVQDTDVTAQIQFVPARLGYGDAFTMRNELTLSIVNVFLEDSFTWSASGYEYTEEPTSGMQWAMPQIVVENETGQPADAPMDFDFVVLADDSQYELTYAGDPSWRYETGNLQPGVVREGRLLFEVPAELSSSDITTVYNRETYEGTTTAYWTD